MEDRWSAAAALVDGSRRALYDYVRRQDHPVNREEAAAAGRMSRSLAAFHLDKLVEAGLLRARYQAPPGRPRRRGRSPKVYEPAQDGLAITIPERRYRLIAEILADAVAGDPSHADGAARRHAYQHGQDLGWQLRDHDGGDGPGPDPVTVLDGLGFEPGTEPDGRVRMRNCPFHALATRHTELVCGLNHAFVGGLVDGLAAPWQPHLAPRPGACCVELRTGPPADSSDPGAGERLPGGS